MCYFCILFRALEFDFMCRVIYRLCSTHAYSLPTCFLLGAANSVVHIDLVVLHAVVPGAGGGAAAAAAVDSAAADDSVVDRAAGAEAAAGGGACLLLLAAACF